MNLAKQSKLLWAGVWVLTLTTAPLLLYVMFGPKDGNPIGLGLLFFFGAPTGIIMTIVGLVRGAMSKG